MGPGAGAKTTDVSIAIRRWLTLREVAAHLGLHPNTVKTIPPEALPFFRITDRGDRRYDESDVERYLERRRVAS